MAEAATQLAIDVRFDARDVPCAPDVADHVRSWFRVHSRRSETSDADGARIARELPDDPDSIHRYLLTEQRRAGRYSPLRFDFTHALNTVRGHSSLYTPRKCVCLREAWRSFVAEAERALAGAEHSVYTVTSDGKHYSDLHAETDIRAWTAYAGHSKWCVKIPAYVALRGESLAEVTMTSRCGRRLRTWTFTQLPAPLQVLASRVRPGSDGYLSTAGAWVRTWPPTMVAVFTAWSTSHRGSDRDTARAMLAAGAGDLSERAARLACRLAEGWTGNTPEDAAALVSTTLAWAAEDPTALVDVLDAWLEALPNGFDTTVAFAERDRLRNAGGSGLTETSAAVACRLLADTWTGDVAELVATAAGIAATSPHR